MSERDTRRPKFCECGGKLIYDELLSMTFSCCERCTPVVTVKLASSGNRIVPETPGASVEQNKGERLQK